MLTSGNTSSKSLNRAMEAVLHNEPSPESGPARKKRIPVCFSTIDNGPIWLLTRLSAVARKHVGRVESLK